MAKQLKEKASDEIECDEWGIPKVPDRIPFPRRFVKNKLDRVGDSCYFEEDDERKANGWCAKDALRRHTPQPWHGYVNYHDAQDAARALEVLNFTLLNSKNIRVIIWIRQLITKRYMILFQALENPFLQDINNYEWLIEGLWICCCGDEDADGKSKCFGFVNFENADDAAKAIEALNEKIIADKEWYVGKAQKKTEREQELKTRFEQTTRETVDKFQRFKLYIKNMDDTIDDDKLK
ncbi:hypothetical protein ACS0TY_027272 [Phlomoides rotata]